MGSGISGETYKARVVKIKILSEDLENEQEVVIKISKIKEDQSLYEKLNSLSKILVVESAGLKRLNGIHCVAQFLDDGVFPYDRITCHVVFIVQKLIEGKQLKEYMNLKFPSANGFKGITNDKDFFKWAKKLAGCLARIHQRQVVHGDIHPVSTVFLK